MSAAKAESLSESVDWKLIEIIANQRAILIVGGLVSLTVAAFSTVRTGNLGSFGGGSSPYPRWRAGSASTRRSRGGGFDQVDRRLGVVVS